MPNLSLPTLPNTAILSEFDPASNHNGMVFAASLNSPVNTVANGVVAKIVQGHEIYGNAVVIGHFDGSASIYGHLGQINVVEGESVGTSRKQIGTSGETAKGKPRLLLEIVQDASYVKKIKDGADISTSLEMRVNPRLQFKKYTEQSLPKAVSATASTVTLVADNRGSVVSAGLNSEILKGGLGDETFVLEYPRGRIIDNGGRVIIAGTELKDFRPITDEDGKIISGQYRSDKGFDAYLKGKDLVVMTAGSDFLDNEIPRLTIQDYQKNAANFEINLGTKADKSVILSQSKPLAEGLSLAGSGPVLKNENNFYALTNQEGDEFFEQRSVLSNFNSRGRLISQKNLIENAAKVSAAAVPLLFNDGASLVTAFNAKMLPNNGGRAVVGVHVIDSEGKSSIKIIDEADQEIFSEAAIYDEIGEAEVVSRNALGIISRKKYPDSISVYYRKDGDRRLVLLNKDNLERVAASSFHVDAPHINWPANFEVSFENGDSVKLDSSRNDVIKLNYPSQLALNSSEVTTNYFVENGGAAKSLQKSIISLKSSSTQGAATVNIPENPDSLTVVMGGNFDENSAINLPLEDISQVQFSFSDSKKTSLGKILAGDFSGFSNRRLAATDDRSTALDSSGKAVQQFSLATLPQNQNILLVGVEDELVKSYFKVEPSRVPSEIPSQIPSQIPSPIPSAIPSEIPSVIPTLAPSKKVESEKPTPQLVEKTFVPTIQASPISSLKPTTLVTSNTNSPLNTGLIAGISSVMGVLFLAALAFCRRKMSNSNRQVGNVNSAGASELDEPSNVAVAKSKNHLMEMENGRTNFKTALGKNRVIPEVEFTSIEIVENEEKSDSDEEVSGKAREYLVERGQQNYRQDEMMSIGAVWHDFDGYLEEDELEVEMGGNKHPEREGESPVSHPKLDPKNQGTAKALQGGGMFLESRR